MSPTRVILLIALSAALAAGGAVVVKFGRPSVEGGATDGGWDLYFRIPGDRVSLRFRNDQEYRSYGDRRVQVPADFAGIHGHAPVPIEIRYKDYLGLPHHDVVVFDVARGISGQTKAYLHEGVNWLVLERATSTSPAHLLANAATDDCVTVRYSLDSDALDRVLPANPPPKIELPGDPKSITYRIDFCDTSRSETLRDVARGPEERYTYVWPTTVAPPSANFR